MDQSRVDQLLQKLPALEAAQLASWQLQLYVALLEGNQDKAAELSQKLSTQPRGLTTDEQKVAYAALLLEYTKMVAGMQHKEEKSCCKTCGKEKRPNSP